MPRTKQITTKRNKKRREITQEGEKEKRKEKAQQLRKQNRQKTKRNALSSKDYTNILGIFSNKGGIMLNNTQIANNFYILIISSIESKLALNIPQVPEGLNAFFGRGSL